MNRIPPQTKQSVTAVTNFSYWLADRMEKNNISAVKLGSYLGIERKTFYAWCSGSRVPRLDVLAKIFFFFDEEEIKVSIKEVTE